MTAEAFEEFFGRSLECSNWHSWRPGEAARNVKMISTVTGGISIGIRNSSSMPCPLYCSGVSIISTFCLAAAGAMAYGYLPFPTSHTATRLYHPYFLNSITSTTERYPSSSTLTVTSASPPILATAMHCPPYDDADYG